MSRLAQIAVVVLLFTGGCLMVNGLWIPVKAIVAQHLLLQAWEQSQETTDIVKPWPWADTWPVGRLQNKRLGIDLIILEGESGEVLAFGPGHIYGSSVPGEGGHCVVAGHRDTSFNFLQNLKIGDRLSLQGKNGTEVYRVQATAVVPAVQLYLDTEPQGLLTLITCYPFDSPVPGATLRFVVTAEEIVS